MNEPRSLPFPTNSVLEIAEAGGVMGQPSEMKALLSRYRPVYFVTPFMEEPAATGIPVRDSGSHIHLPS